MQSTSRNKLRVIILICHVCDYFKSLPVNMSKRNSEFTDHLQRENLIIKINRCDQVNGVSEFPVGRVKCKQCPNS